MTWPSTHRSLEASLQPAGQVSPWPLFSGQFPLTCPGLFALSLDSSSATKPYASEMFLPEARKKYFKF